MKQQNIVKNIMNSMRIHNTNRMLKVIASVIFTVFIFTFLHSEFGLFDFDEGKHGTHDYCEIVKTATTKVSKETTSYVIKLTVDKSICYHCIDERNQQTKAFSILDSEQFHTPQKTTKVYLFKRTFLI